jgi:hypothetical protein
MAALKGMMGALAPFSYLVIQRVVVIMLNVVAPSASLYSGLLFSYEL